jgi:hypothetical protein
MKYEKIMEIQTRQVMTLDLDPTNTNLLTEQTFVDWQTSWADLYFDNYYTGTTSYPYWIMAGLWGETDNQMPWVENIFGIFQNIRDTRLLTYNFANTTSNQLERAIAKLDKLAGDDGNGNPNINVNFQPIQQALTDINDNVDISRQRLSDIEQHAFHISENTDQLKEINIGIVRGTESIKDSVTDGFTQANTTLDHIDTDLHDIKTDLGDLVLQFGDGGSINGDTIKNLSESIANELNLTMSPILQAETQKVVDSIDQKFELASSDMSQVGVAETAGNYLNSELRSATDQLKSELQGLQYTNINAVVYDYDEYNNYYDLQSYSDNPTSNDAFIRQKVQDYIDAVNYATENVKGQITTRLDDLKQSTLLTTEYDSKWLVVKQGALYSKNGNQFPDKDWQVDFSKVKLDSGIAKAIYDWIYYIMACVIIYKQFRKVAD